jgi:cell division protein FtsQ
LQVLLGARRDLGARVEIVSVDRPFAASAARPFSSTGSPGRGRISAVGSRLGGLLAGSVRGATGLLGHRRLRLTLIGGVIGALLLGGGWLWLRDSPLVSVEHVHVSGVHGVGAREIRLALDDAAKRMSTLDANVGALRARLASFAQVRSLSVSTSFPHTMRITVSEQLPVAVLLSNGTRTALAANGVVLGRAFLAKSLPVIESSKLALTRVHDSQTLQYLKVLGAAPAPLAKYITRAYTSGKGLTLALQNGMLVYFGDASRPHAKWLSLARVLADPTSTGAAYIDVRMPERPAAGIAGAATSTSTQASGLDPNSAVLAQTLASAITGESSSSTPASPSASEPAVAQTSPSSEAASGETASSGSASSESAAPTGG